jgi:hypothetical protein
MSNSSICSSNVTSGFIDLATFDEIEKYMYGGPCALAYFVRETRKSTWFTQVPVVLTSRSSTPAFNQEWSVSISRAGDYLLQTWLRLTTPSVSLSPNNKWGYKGSVRWTRNLMHNLIKDCCITFNDLVAARFDNYFLDFWTAFTVPAGKRNGYNNMIGNIDDLTMPHCVGETIPAVTLNLPLPFWYSRDSGVALPTAALPYNEMRINFSFRDWKDLLILDYCCKACVAGNCLCENSPIPPNPVVPPDNANYYPCATGSVSNPNYVAPNEPFCGEKLSVPICDASWLCGVTPTLGQVQVWANYAIVSNDERKRMACAPRDILIEQTQMTNRQCFNPCNNKTPQYDIRFSHAIKVLFFAVRNTTNPAEWSNYTTASPVVNCYSRGPTKDCCACPRGNGRHIDFSPPGAADPILQTSLVYENTSRLAQMGSDYFSLVNPYYHAPHIPYETGYHMYSYSLDFICLDPMGSTNYGKLTNVSIYPEASDAAVKSANIPVSKDCYVAISNEKCKCACNPGCKFKACDAPTNCPTSNCGACNDNSGESNRCAGTPSSQSYEFICCAVNNNIIRISGGKTPRVPPTADCYESYDNTFIDKQCNLSSFNNNLIECM